MMTTILRWNLVTVMILLCAATLPLCADETVVLTVIDVGQGDAILIEFPPGASGNRKVMLTERGWIVDPQ